MESSLEKLPRKSFHPSSPEKDSFKGPILMSYSLVTSLLERSTNQYLAQSLAVTDYISLAATPICIASVKMAAIRVGGPPWLKALVGRADETTATVELDLMSSNLETTEVWNGRDLARCIGRGAVREVLVLYHGKGLPKNAVKRVMSFSEALTKGYLDSCKLRSPPFPSVYES